MVRTDSASDPADSTISKLTLIISSTSLEQRFWKSLKVLSFFDLVGLVSSVMLNVMLIHKFGFGRDEPHMLWHFLPVLLYLSAGLVQLAVLVLRPELHQRYRFAINLANRLVKCATVTWAAVNMSQTDVMKQFTATLNSVPLVVAGEHSTTAYLKILRTVASLPLLWVSHALNFMLPFWLLLPLQLYTLLAVSRVIPSIVCVLLGQPPHVLQPAAVIATRVHGFVKVVAALAIPVPVGPPTGWQAGGSRAGGTSDAVARDLLVLVAVTFIMILVIIPCAVAYNVELLWKVDFLRTHNRSTASASSAALHKGSWPVSPLWVTVDIICLTLLMCEGVVLLEHPLQCDRQAHLA